MGLRIDENWRACRVAIGNPLCGEAFDEVLGGQKAMRFALPKGENRGATRELERSSAGHCASPRWVETGVGHGPAPVVSGDEDIPVAGHREIAGGTSDLRTNRRDQRTGRRSLEPASGAFRRGFIASARRLSALPGTVCSI